MKMRNGFISNSSSSSFIISKNYMSNEQIDIFNKFLNEDDSECDEYEYGEYGFYNHSNLYYFGFQGDQKPVYKMYKKMIEIGVDPNKILNMD